MPRGTIIADPVELENFPYSELFKIFERFGSSALSRNGSIHIVKNISGHQTLDHHGVLGRRVGLGPDEGREVRGEPHPDHSERSSERPRLPPLRDETS